MELTINKLVANDIINYGMDQTSGFDYSVSLEGYLSDYDEESKKYIFNNIDSIIEDIVHNENISFFDRVDKDGDTYLNMIFYWDKLLNQIEKIVYDNAELYKVDLELDEVREIASDLIDDDSFNDALTNSLKEYNNGQELG